MITTGTFNKLKVTRSVSAGIYVDAGQYGEIMIPGWDVISKVEAGDLVEVFLFIDAQRKVVASMRKPLAMPGETALMRVAEIIDGGAALLEWGMPRKLFVPASEQAQKMVKGYSYVVYVRFDQKTHQMIGSSKLERYLATSPEDLEINQEVDLLICDQSDLGYRAVINGRSLGFIYSNDIFQAIKVGDKLKGYVKNIREDGRVDLYLQKPGYGKILDLGSQIIEKLRQNGGFIAVTDHSSPELISELFGISKKNYKKAVGGLYKQGLVSIDADGIRLKATK